MLYIDNLTSWWWAYYCSKHVEGCNIMWIKKFCTLSWYLVNRINLQSCLCLTAGVSKMLKIIYPNFCELWSSGAVRTSSDRTFHTPTTAVSMKWAGMFYNSSILRLYKNPRALGFFYDTCYFYCTFHCLCFFLFYLIFFSLLSEPNFVFRFIFLCLSFKLAHTLHHHINTSIYNRDTKARNLCNLSKVRTYNACSWPRLLTFPFVRLWG